MSRVSAIDQRMPGLAGFDIYCDGHHHFAPDLTVELSWKDRLLSRSSNVRSGLEHLTEQYDGDAGSHSFESTHVDEIRRGVRRPTTAVHVLMLGMDVRSPWPGTGSRCW